MPAGPRSDRVGVSAFGRVWVLRRASAAEWINACTGPELAGVFPGLVCDRDVSAVWDSMLGDPDFDRRCTNTARIALTRAAGREWWWSYNMMAEARQAWVHLNGKLLLAGVSSRREPLPDWLDAAYVQLLALHDEAGQNALNARLRRIPATARNIRPKMSSRADLLAFARD